MSYIFYIHPHLYDTKVIDIMTTKVITASDGEFYFIEPITEAVVAHAHDPKGNSHFWGIGLDYAKFLQLMSEYRMNYSVEIHDTYTEQIYRGCNSINLSSFNGPDSHSNDMIVLAPTDTALRNVIFPYKENGHNK